MYSRASGISARAPSRRSRASVRSPVRHRPELRRRTASVSERLRSARARRVGNSPGGGVAAGETKTYTGEVELPAGGWVAVRAYASERQSDAWPSMHARPFAHSSPVWIGAIGSTDPAARAAAARDLLRAIDAAEKQAREAYGKVETPRFDAARARLVGLLESTGVPEGS